MICVHVLPFDAESVRDPCRTIASIDDLINTLSNSEGEPDKPVRLLKFEGKSLVAKFSMSHSARQASIRDELSNLRALAASPLAFAIAPHVATVQWGGSTSSGCVVCTEYVRPARLLGLRVHTLRQLAASGLDEEWRYALFQTLFTLAAIQTAFPGFRHNDLKGDNVLVTSSSETLSYALDANDCDDLPMPLRVRRAWRFRPRVRAKLIDFELSSTPRGEGIASAAILNANNKSFREDFGLTGARCDIFDAHLLLFDTLTAAEASPKAQGLARDLRDFALCFVSPERLRPEGLTTQCRLREEDQTILQKTLGPRVLLNMLAHSYFFALRADRYADADIVVKLSKCQ